MKKFVSFLLAVVIVSSMVPLAVTAGAATAPKHRTGDDPVISESVPETTAETTVEASEAQETTADTTAAEETTAPTETTEPATQETTEPVITPNAPKNFSVKSTGKDNVIIRWDKTANATSYVISRADEKSNGKMGKYAVIKTIDDMNINSYKNTANIKAGTVYKYKIVAKRASVTTTTSPASTVTAMTNPDDVKTLKVSKKTTTTMEIKWSKNSKATKYIIERADENSNGKFDGYKKIKTVKSSVTSYADKGLKTGYAYKYKVKVQRTKSSITKNSSGKAVKNVTTLAAPQNLKNLKSTTTAIKIGWDAVNKASKYEVYRKDAKTKYAKLKTTSATTYTDKNVTTGKNYKYKVRAVRVIAKKNYYGTAAAVKTSTAVTSVNGLTVKSILNRGLFSWNSVAGASGYDIFVKKSDGTWLKKASTPYTNYLTGKLKSGKTYTFQIKPYKGSGDGKVYGQAKTASVTPSNTAYGQTPSGTWVEVCIETQQMYMYVNNKLYVSTPVITGYAYNDRRTTKGYHHVLSKASPANLRGSYGGSSWNVTVSYWLGFTGDGQGIHDATWQPNFGGEYYKNSSRGSHGCVNTPTSAVSKIYSKAYVGMPVIVY